MCCKLCQETPGCKVWTHIVDPDQFNEGGACWIKSSVVKKTATPSITGGIIPPIVKNKTECGSMRGVGFKDLIPYNHPDLLVTDNAETCCLRCQEQDTLCFGWMWMTSDKQCHLYGAPIPSSAEVLCRDCISGHRIAKRDSIKNRCDGEAGALYKGDGRISLVPKGGFITRTSKECCGLCDATRECRSWTWSKISLECSLNGDVPQATENFDFYGGISKRKVCEYEECETVEGVAMAGSDLSCTQYAAPFGDFLVVASPEDCCAKCQEYPECAAWTFTEGDPNQPPSACWLKFSPPTGPAQKPVGGQGTYVTGIIRSRLTDEQIEQFREDSKNAIEVSVQRGGIGHHLDELEIVSSKDDDGGGGFPVGAIAAVVVVVVIILVLCIVTGLFFVRRSKKREEKINQKRLEGIQNAAGKPLMSTNPRSSADTISSARVATDSGDLSGGLSGLPIITDVQMEPEDVRVERLAQLKQKMAEFRKFPGGSGVSSGRHDQTALELNPGMVLGDKYVIEEGTHGGDTSHVFNARPKFGHVLPVIMKFYSNKAAYETELNFFGQQLLPLYVPQVFDMFEESVVESWGLPPFPCIVMERGNDTLSKWLEKSRGKMDSMDQKNILFKICSAVQSVHQHGIVHRSLSPENILLYTSSMSWKLIDFGHWAKRGSKASIDYSLRYAPPEMLMAHAKGDKEVVAKPAIDMWALGMIFWEVLTGDPMFGENYSDEEVMAMLIGVEPLPFEKDPNLWGRINHPAARRLVAHLLHRSPNARYPITKVLSSGFFSTGADTVQKQNASQHKEMIKKIAQGVGRIEEKVEQGSEVLMENFKHTVGNVLFACFSFYEISPEEFIDKSPSASDLAEGFKNSTLKFTETLFEPSFNVFKRSKEEPTPLLRLDKKHLVKITLMYGKDNLMELPIQEIAYCKIWPTDIGHDVQSLPVFSSGHRGYVLDTIGVWDTLAHSDHTLKLIGSASLDIVIGMKMKMSDKIVEVRKTIEVRMMDPAEKFRLVKAFYRTKEWYSNLPPWAKLYIHGAVTIVKLSTKVVV